MKFSTLQHILHVFGQSDQLKPSEIALRLNKNRDTVHKYLKILVEQGKLIKYGKTPHVRYGLSSFLGGQQNITKIQYDFDYKDIQILDTTFLKYDARGGILQGVEGFVDRCESRQFDPIQKSISYLSIYNYLQSQINNCGLLDAKKALAQHVQTLYLDQLYYADQYTWMEFGRGKVAEMTFYAKQSQNYQLIQESINLFVRKIECLIKTTQVDALAFTPASIKRQYQILDCIDARLSHIALPRINLVKYYPNKVIVPQKSLKSRVDRLQNARETIFVYDTSVRSYKKVLLIDDFV
jgi:Txe/YoeB family toxin of Txe-Axe toxin-antitoxin module